MQPMSRSGVLWSAGAAVAALVAGGAVIASQGGGADKATIAAGKVAMTPSSPYVAIANGKADVDGGVIAIAARRAGIVREVLVNEGDLVTEGQILARLEDEEPRLAAAAAAADLAQTVAQIEATQVQIAAAQREYDRLKELAASNYIAAQRLDQAQDTLRHAKASLVAQNAAVSAAQAKLDQANYDLELTVIRAPKDGRILRRYANPGSGASTLNVSDMFDLEPDGKRIVRAEISESALPYVAVGQAVQVSPEADPGRAYDGKVVRRAAMFGARKLRSDDSAERVDERVVEVVVSVDGAPFLIGQRVLVKFLKG